MFILEIHL